jgi:hypothetical protein
MTYRSQVTADGCRRGVGTAAPRQITRVISRQSGSDGMIDAETGADRGERIKRIYRELADEHRRIMALVEQLSRHRSLLQLAPMLEELHSLLINHFAREQFPGGLYESLGGFGSEHHLELRELVSEHCLILSSLRGVLERTRLAGAADAPTVLHEVAAVVENLRRHEHKEHALAEKLLAT